MCLFPRFLNHQLVSWHLKAWIVGFHDNWKTFWGPFKAYFKGLLLAAVSQLGWKFVTGFGWFVWLKVEPSCVFFLVCTPKPWGNDKAVWLICLKQLVVEIDFFDCFRLFKKSGLVPEWSFIHNCKGSDRFINLRQVDKQMWRLRLWTGK